MTFASKEACKRRGERRMHARKRGSNHRQSLVDRVLFHDMGSCANISPGQRYSLRLSMLHHQFSKPLGVGLEDIKVKCFLPTKRATFLVASASVSLQPREGRARVRKPLVGHTTSHRSQSHGTDYLRYFYSSSCEHHQLPFHISFSSQKQ